MKKRMHVRLFMLLFYLIFAVTALPITANADMGPKPSVRIQFKNMGDDLCYGTLLSKEACTGPARVWDGTSRNEQLYDLDRDIWKAFVDYKDPDGYYFLQRGWTVSETGEIAWTYYPPGNFRSSFIIRKPRPLFQAESMSVMHLIHITLWTWRESGSDPWNTMRT